VGALLQRRPVLQSLSEHQARLDHSPRVTSQARRAELLSSRSSLPHREPEPSPHAPVSDAAPIQRMPIPATGLLRPHESHQEWVSVDVPSDGSCLFHSVFLSSVATQLREELGDSALRGLTPDELADMVRDRASAVLGVARDDLRTGLTALQRQQRATVVAHWADHADAFRAPLRGDIRGLLLSYLGRLGALNQNHEDAAIPAVSASDVGVLEDDFDSGASEDDFDASSSEDEATTQAPPRPDLAPSIDEQGSPRPAPPARPPSVSERKQALAPITTYLAGLGELPAEDEELGEPLDALLDAEELGVSELLAPVPGKWTALSKRNRPDDDSPVEDIFKPKSRPEARPLENALRAPVGRGVRAGSPFDVLLRTLVIEKLAEQLEVARRDGNASPPSFNGAEFSDRELESLIPAYREEFHRGSLFAGQAALDALRATQGLNIESHIFSPDGGTHVQGTEEALPATHVLEGGDHFQVLVGPFSRGLLQPNLRPQVWPSFLDAEPAPEDPGFDFTQEHTLSLESDAFDVDALGIGVGADKRMTAYVDDGERREPMMLWLERMMRAEHLGSPALRNLRRFLSHRIDGQLLTEELNPLLELSFIAERLLEVGDLGAEGLEAETGLEDAHRLFVHEGRVYTNRLIPLASMLGAVLEGPLSRGKGHAGARLVHDLLTTVTLTQAEPEGLQDDQVDEDARDAGLRSIADALTHLSGRLGVGSLKQATRTRDMPPLRVRFHVFEPSAKEIAKALKQTRGKQRYDETDTFDLENFKAEVLRQVLIQQERLNEMRMDRWFMNRDLFNLRVHDRRGPLLENRSPGYQSALIDELHLRGARYLETLGSRGRIANKKQRLGTVSRDLFAQTSGKDSLERLSARESELHAIRKGRPFDPDLVLDDEAEREIREHLLELLERTQETGRQDEEGNAQTEDVVRDLVGRSNDQGTWRKAKSAEVVNAIKPMAPKWAGLYPGRPEAPLRGLAVLHSPDQVAGGEREIPRDAQDLTEYIGPSIVNSALGATWGLPVASEGGVLAPLATRLEHKLLKHFPEESWPLWKLNLVLEVLFSKGSHIIPGGKK